MGKRSQSIQLLGTIKLPRQLNLLNKVLPDAQFIVEVKEEETKQA